MTGNGWDIPLLSRTDAKLSSENTNGVRDQWHGLVNKAMNFIHRYGVKRSIRNVGVYQNYNVSSAFTSHEKKIFG
jgi:hypothetical protein